MKIKIDTHIHSHLSHDSNMDIDGIIRFAKKKGLGAVAICDHNKVFTDDIPETDILVIRGGEFSTEYGHLLGLFIDRDVVGESLREIADAIHGMGGITVLAHPFEKGASVEFIEGALPYIDGIEVFNSRADRKHKDANRRAHEFAVTHGIKFFAGSDAHSEKEIGNAYSVIEYSGDLKSDILSGNATVVGKNTPAVFTAYSQLTKLRKNHSRLWKYLIWSAFSVKCLLTDLFNRKEKTDVTYCEDR